jgi:uncharacterized protein
LARGAALFGDGERTMMGRISAVLGLALFLVAAGAGGLRAADYGDNPAEAARDNDAAAVRAILAGGTASPNQTDSQQRTALHYAALNGNGEMVAVLIKAGAELNVTDSLGNTPLHLAAERNQTEAAKLLLASGAKIDPQNRDGVTPLMIAAERGNVDLVRFLLADGASPSLTDYTGRDALAWAEDGQNPAAVAVLKRAEAGKGS